MTDDTNGRMRFQKLDKKGKAPPEEAFTGNKADQLWDDWLPTLESSGSWYGQEENERKAAATCRPLMW